MKRLVNLNTGIVIIEALLVPSTFMGKLRGYAFRKRPCSDTGMFFPQTRSVHTLGMFFPLDVYFFDPSMRLLGKSRNVLPGSFLSSPPETRHILEVPHRGIHRSLAVRAGERVAILPGGEP